jgi:hypothetical protein
MSKQESAPVEPTQFLERMQAGVIRVETIRATFAQLGTVRKALESELDIEAELRAFFQDFSEGVAPTESAVKKAVRQHFKSGKEAKTGYIGLLHDNYDKLITAEERAFQKDPIVEDMIGKTVTIKPLEEDSADEFSFPMVGFGAAETIFDQDSSITGTVRAASVFGIRDQGKIFLESVEYKLGGTRSESGHTGKGHVSKMFTNGRTRESVPVVKSLVSVEMA